LRGTRLPRLRRMPRLQGLCARLRWVRLRGLRRVRPRFLCVGWWLRLLWLKRRKAAGLNRPISAKYSNVDYISDVETGQKIVGVLELMERADAIGLDAVDAIKRLKKLSRKGQVAKISAFWNMRISSSAVAPHPAVTFSV
jgi:hypothetical protein